MKASFSKMPLKTYTKFLPIQNSSKTKASSLIVIQLLVAFTFTSCSSNLGSNQQQVSAQEQADFLTTLREGRLGDEFVLNGQPNPATPGPISFNATEVDIAELRFCLLFESYVTAPTTPAELVRQVEPERINSPTASFIRSVSNAGSFMVVLACINNSRRRTFGTDIIEVNETGNGGEMACETEQPSMRSTITQRDTTLVFDQDYLVGRHADGGFWVAAGSQGSVKVIDKLPRSRYVGSHVKHGGMIDPAPGQPHHGFDNSINESYSNQYPSYNDSANVVLNLDPNNAATHLTIQPNSILVLMESVDGRNQMPQADDMVTVSIYNQPPTQPCSFRPSSSDPNKTVRFSAADIRWDRLLDLPVVSGTPDPDLVADLFIPYRDHVGSWQGRPMNPKPEYGRDWAGFVSIMSALLNLEIPRPAKKRMLYPLIQVGIDLYARMTNGGENSNLCLGGLNNGVKWPIVFAGLMLDDPAMTNIAQTGIQFSEDCQAFYVTETAPGVYNNGNGGYGPEDEGMADWGIRHGWEPELDNKDWGSTYRLCCTANSWSGSLLAARMMNAVSIWDHNATFDYMDRYVTINENPPFFVPGYQKFLNGIDEDNAAFRALDNLTESEFLRNFWFTYRPLF